MFIDDVITELARGKRRDETGVFEVKVRKARKAPIQNRRRVRVPEKRVVTIKPGGNERRDQPLRRGRTRG